MRAAFRSRDSQARAGGGAACLGLLVALGLVAGSAAIASADSRSAANDAFERGRKLMKAKQYAEACAAFEQSQQLDPQFGTQFNLADCESSLGKLTSARAGFRELARVDTNKQRRDLSAKLAADLEKRLPHVTLKAPSRPGGLAILLDGKEATDLIGEAIPLDLGEHALVANAPGFVELTKAITVATEGSAQTIEIRLKKQSTSVAPVASAPTEAPVESVATDAPRAPTSRRKTYSTVAMIGGSALVAGGLVTGGLAYRSWQDAKSCDLCASDEQRSRSQHARLLGNVSTVLVVTGLVAASAGVYLWKTTSSSALVAPQAGTDSAGIAITGTF